MRWLFVLDGLGTGGIETVGVTYANLLAMAGHEVTVLNLAPRVQLNRVRLLPEVRYAHWWFPRKFMVERVYGAWFKWKGDRRLRARLWQIVAVPNFFLAWLWRRCALWLYRWTHARNVAVAVAFSGHYNDLVLVGSVYTGKAATIGWCHGDPASYALISPAYVPLYRRLDGLVCLVSDMVQDLRLANPEFNIPIRRIYNPIEVHHAADPTAKHVKEQFGRYIVSVGRLEGPPKDPETVIRAFAALDLRCGGSSELSLVFVGSGAMVPGLETLATRLGVRDRVHFVGNIIDPAPFFKAAEISVFSSLGPEGLPTVILESLASGTPVVASDVPTGPREILEGGFGGVLFEPSNHLELAARIEQVLLDSKLRSDLLDRGKQRIRAFSGERAVQALVEYVEELGGPGQLGAAELNW